MNSEAIVLGVIDCLGRAHFHSSLNLLTFALQIIAWAKISVEELVPSDLSLINNLTVHTPREIPTIFRHLSTHESLGEDGRAFESFEVPSNSFSSSRILNALNLACDAAKNGLLKNFVIPEDTYLSVLNGREEFLLLPKEVSELMTYLAGDLLDKTVYCPYDSLCLIARRVDEKGGKASVETTSTMPIPWLTNILTGSTIPIRAGQPLLQPSFLQDGKLQQFDISIAFPPFGERFNSSLLKQDLFNRFKIGTTSGPVLHLSHIVSQTKKRAVIAVQNSLLFSRVAHSLREYLLERHMIEKVISMPPALLPSTSIPFSILVLNIEGTSSNVRFVNSGAEQFFTRDGRNRSKLVNWESLIETIESSRDEALVADISVDDILEKNDAQLEVSRYLLSKEQKIIQKVFLKSTVRPLGELVEFIRPVNFTRKDELSGNIIFEVGVGDFPNYGYISSFAQTLTLPHDEFTKKVKNSLLHPYDIVIAVKGNVGKVGIISPNCSTTKKNAWVISQSCLILRTSGTIIDPRVLFIYLRSDIGQTLLASLVSGATVPFIQLNHLRELNIIVPTMKECQSIIETFEHEIAIQAQVEEMNRNLKVLKRTHWSFEN